LGADWPLSLPALTFWGPRLEQRLPGIMGKKKDKLAAQQQQQQQQQVPWKNIDKDPLCFLVAPEVSWLRVAGSETVDSMCISWTASTQLHLHRHHNDLSVI
jgi:hypothetical protein